jgi:hypothetical protein
MISHDKKSVDALLATACTRMLRAGNLLNQMRALQLQNRDEDYWRTAVQLGEHLTVGGHAIEEAHRILMAKIGIALQGNGGWIH